MEKKIKRLCKKYLNKKYGKTPYPAETPHDVIDKLSSDLYGYLRFIVKWYNMDRLGLPVLAKTIEYLETGPPELDDANEATDLDSLPSKLYRMGFFTE